MLRRVNSQVRRGIRYWPVILSSAAALVPVAMLLAVIVLIVKGSLLALDYVGFHDMLFTGKFSATFTNPPYSYGLLGAIWATMILLAVSMLIAIPTSLALAVFATEFPETFWGRRIREALGVLAGIPPVVYGLVAVLFLSRIFAIPDFSTLTGGILLALLVIPFMAPLVDDALQNAPNELKEASLALGATRWYTLKNATLPAAFPGIVSAVALGSLKAMGDVIIIIFAVGYVPYLPSPLWDITGRGAPLTSAGAGLAGSFSRGGAPILPESQAWLESSVGYFSALILLAMAIAVLCLLSILQWRSGRLQKTAAE